MATGRASVRAAVVAFVTPPAVANLNKIFTAWPRRNPWPDYVAGQPAGTLSGAVGVVHITRDDERRRSIGGATSGKKSIEYEVELQLILRSTKNKPEDAVDDYDALIEAVKVKLRSDHTLGSTDIWQAAEPEMWVESADPQLTPEGATEIWGAVHFVVWQWLTA